MKSGKDGPRHPVLRELGLTAEIIRKYVVPRAAVPVAEARHVVNAVRGLCPSRAARVALRAERRRLGLNTATGRPLVNRKHPELAGLPKRVYNKMLKERSAHD